MSLAKYGDTGYGAMVAEDKYHAAAYRKELVNKAAEVIGSYVPNMQNMIVTSIPSHNNTKVERFARELADILGYEYGDFLIAEQGALQQKTMQNGFYQYKNAAAKIKIKEDVVITGNVILVDDIVDSRWTLTVAGCLLRKAGAERVFPFCLADSSQKRCKMINENEIITILCADFGDEYTPLTRSAFWKLYHQYGDSVKTLAESNEESVTELLKRSGSVSFSLQKIEQKGIKILTFLDERFPKRLLEKLGDFCPPLLYCCGDPSICEGKFVGYVGSRNIDENDILWTEKNVSKNLSKRFGIVSGGAKGIDSVAINYALNHGGKVVVFLADNMNEKIKDAFILKHIWDENLVIFSHFSPCAKKTHRNRSNTFG